MKSKGMREFLAGLKAAIPVGVGYLAVSFGFGALASSQGLPPWASTLISLTNITSAGQFAGLRVIAEAGPLWLMVLTQLVINSRYALMSLALGQQMGPEFTLPRRFIMAFYNTDEIFALAIEQGGNLTVPFMYGLGVLPILGWTAGTLAGGLAGDLLSASVRTALGVALYGMFVAIVLPQARGSKPLAVASVLGCLFGALFQWLPFLSTVQSGLAIVLSTVAAAAITAVLFPLPDQPDASAVEKTAEGEVSP